MLERTPEITPVADVIFAAMCSFDKRISTSKALSEAGVCAIELIKKKTPPFGPIVAIGCRDTSKSIVGMEYDGNYSLYLLGLSI